MDQVNYEVTKPLVVVSGCTGTGKSDLAIAIAKKFNGEVISADSMQIYRGLDIVTNKVTSQEMEGVRHHLMSFYDPTMAEYNVHQFKKDALHVMDGLWKANKLPVIAGGTQYYVESVIYKGNLVDEHNSRTVDNPEVRRQLESLSSEELHQKLKQLDPGSALSVHKNNRSRVLRAVEICMLTGRTKSEIIERQKRDQSDLDGGLRFENTLLINMDAHPAVLDQRLKKRIDKMVARGLEGEMTSFYDEFKDSMQSHGILQSIGIKEFLHFLQLPQEDRTGEKGQKMFKKGCSELTLHTVQYAKRQRRWLKSRLLTRKNIRQMPQIVGMDASSTDRFLKEIIPAAAVIVERFLKKEELKLDEFDGDLVVDLLHQVAEEELRQEGHAKRANMIFECEVCGIDVHGEGCWKSHLRGRRHVAAVKRRKRESCGDVERDETG